MKPMKVISAAGIALALLLFAGCKQADIRQSRAAVSGPETRQTLGDLVDAETEAVESAQTAQEPEIILESWAEAEAKARAEADLLHSELFERQQGDVIEIAEEVFIAQTNDIYLNAQDYLGKTLVYEGLYKSSVIMGADGEAELIHYVVRYGPGCCSFDDNAGFEVVYDGAWPQEDEWVEVVGTLEEYDLDGWKFLCVEISDLTVKQERGAEYVSQ